MKKLFLTLTILFSFNAQALVVSEADVLNAIKDEAQKSDVELEIFSGKTSFDIKNAEKFKILVSDLKFDDYQGKFTCKIEVFADSMPFDSTSIMGKVYNLVSAYLPKENINKNTIIKEDMLKAIVIKENKIKDVYTTKLEDIVGKEAKSNLNANSFIYNKDIQRPILVKRKELTLVLYKTDKMEIGTKAYAESNGAYGDIIELINPSSKKRIMGKVVAKNTVVIEGD